MVVLLTVSPFGTSASRSMQAGPLYGQRPTTVQASCPQASVLLVCLQAGRTVRCFPKVCETVVLNLSELSTVGFHSNQSVIGTIAHKQREFRTGLYYGPGVQKEGP
jgi:hypothetical protein